VLDRLQEERLLSDQRYATQRVVARAGRYGNARLRRNCARKASVTMKSLAALPEAGDESERCRAVWARKFGELPQSPKIGRGRCVSCNTAVFPARRFAA
jgi:regulatory protein